ncbi:unnamed protein product [Lymnaea stagnalis]|uniref:Uncharacterized protein n=1 Tax=Lymnaea stagnalis TaxID=6523 RepID=A0AAV2HHH5_LYMST
MASFKKKLRLWQQEIWDVACKPTLLFPLVIVGFFMLWLAEKQVGLTLSLLGHNNYTFGRLDKFKYVVNGVFIVVYLWVDLFLIRCGIAACNSVIRSYQDLSHNATAVPPDPSVIARKNPARACRKVY